MKKVLKAIGLTIVTLVVLLFLLFAGFLYKVKNGLPFYETEIPKIDFPDHQPSVLLFSKSTGFRHAGSIDTAKQIIRQLAIKNNWFIYETESGGVFNENQLSKFDVVIFNNSTGKLLNDQQKLAFENYIQNGGSFMGIHGAGDNSHHWAWYVKNLTGADFSHHAITEGFKLQNTSVQIQPGIDSLLSIGISASFDHADEWYVFYENPEKFGFHIIASINGNSINTNGNMKLLASDKNFGMGKFHPVAWYKSLDKGKSFYTSMGHDPSTWRDPNFVKLIENAMAWSIKK